MTAGKLSGSAAILAGDFNTGLHRIDEVGATLSCADQFSELLKSGWRDAFRQLHPSNPEWSWWGPRKKDGTRNGFRLDHVFLSPSFPWAVRRADYLREVDGSVLVDPRAETGKGALSDHAALVVELSA